VRIEELSDRIVRPETCAVVADPASPRPVLLAAKQLSQILSRRFGKKVPLRKTPDGAAFAFVVGTNRWSAAAGLRTLDLKDGQYRVKSTTNAVYVAGAGEAARYGVCDFLRREAGCRFYFPGELGEIVPTADDLPLQKLDYTADIGAIRCYQAAASAEDGFKRHLDFCVRKTEKLPEGVRPNVFFQDYLNDMFGATVAQWYMQQLFAGKGEKHLQYARDAAEKDGNPLAVRRIELFKDFQTTKE